MKQKIKQCLRWIKNTWGFMRTKIRKKPKIFVIGFNKTGTTTVFHALKEFDILVGDQRSAELLMKDIIQGKTKLLLQYCQTAEAFQDVPFSKPGFFKLLDTAFPHSKFILTIRDSPEQWFSSTINFQSKIKGEKGRIPTWEDFENDDYVYKGWSYMMHKWSYGEGVLFDEEKYKAIYSAHVDDVLDYFRDRPNDLLVINVSEAGSYKKLCSFIGQHPLRDTFEWKNKTSEIKK